MVNAGSTNLPDVGPWELAACEEEASGIANDGASMNAVSVECKNDVSESS